MARHSGDHSNWGSEKVLQLHSELAQRPRGWGRLVVQERNFWRRRCCFWCFVERGGLWILTCLFRGGLWIWGVWIQGLGWSFIERWSLDSSRVVFIERLVSGFMSIPSNNSEVPVPVPAQLVRWLVIIGYYSEVVSTAQTEVLFVGEVGHLIQAVVQWHQSMVQRF